MSRTHVFIAGALIACALVFFSSVARANNVAIDITADPPANGVAYQVNEIVRVAVRLRDETTDVNSLELAQVDLKLTNATIVPQFDPNDPVNPITDPVIFGGAAAGNGETQGADADAYPGPLVPGCPAGCLTGSVPSASGGGTVYFWLRTGTANSALLNPPAAAPGRLFIQFKIQFTPADQATIDAIGLAIDDGWSSGAFFQQAVTGTVWANGDGDTTNNVVGEPVTLSVVPPSPQVYVDRNATGTNNGLSWINAFTSIQSALPYVANSGGFLQEIWVADGIYRADETASDPSGTGDRAATFQLMNGVAVYGGFEGADSVAFPGGETMRSQRNPSMNATILSGDLSADDGPDFANTDENSLHVVTGTGTDFTAVLDGFTITAGNANEYFSNVFGAGVFSISGSFVIANCVITQNQAAFAGGGIFSGGGEPRIIGSVISGNDGGMQGGGVRTIAGSPQFIGCTFDGNVADDGGGLYQNGSAALVNCMLRSNSAWQGGALYSFDGAPAVVNSIVAGNSATYGAGLFHRAGAASLANCTVAGNTAGVHGAGLYLASGDPSLANCVVYWNSAGGSMAQPAQLFVSSGVRSISHCDIQGWTGSLGGAGNFDADPLFTDADGPDDIYGTADDDLRLQAYSPCIDAGNNGAVPADSLDLDGDGDTIEPTPLDISGGPRFIDDPSVADTGSGAPPIVDIGAYEFEGTPLPIIVSANPPLDNPYLPGEQPFRDVLQTGASSVALQGIGSCLTPGAGDVVYCPIMVTFSVPITLALPDVIVTCSHTGPVPCPAVAEVEGSGPGPYLISLDGPIPPGGCTEIAFPIAAPGQVLRYEYLPGDVNMDGATNTIDLLTLEQGLHNGVANLPSNLARYDMNRSGIVNTGDLLRLVQLLNGVNTTQVWNGATFVPCP